MGDKSTAATYKKSLFRKMVFYYVIISFATIILFCFVWYQSTSEWMTNQNLGYNRQQLEAIYKTIESQHLSLKQTQRRLYIYQVDDGISIYNLFKNYNNKIHLFSSLRTVDYLEEKLELYNYVQSIERPRERNLRLFMLSGLSFHREDIFFSQTSGYFEPEPFAELIAGIVAEHETIPSRRSVYTVPTFTAAGNNGEIDIYVLYDYIRDDVTASIITGYVINAYSPDCFDAVLRDFIDPLVGRAYVLDNNGCIIYDSAGEAYGSDYQDFTQINHRKSTVYNNGSQRTTVLYSNPYGFYVVGELNARSAFSFNTESYTRIFQVAAIACILTALLSVLVVRSTARRVMVLLASIFAARTDIKTRAPVSGEGDELDAISSELNVMLERVETHIHLSYIKEIEQRDALLRQRDAELYALQSQVNPHFLYNTLEIIRMKALANKDEDTAMMIKSLAALFRERAKGSGALLLKQELAVCRQVMEIYSIRYDSAISLLEDIPAPLLSCAVLRDILTPLLENVMVHGVGHGMDPEDMLVEVNGRQEGSDLILEVSDNGAGISDEQLQKMNAAFQQPVFRNNSHVGIMNIHNRIRLVYGENYGLSIGSPMGRGTIIRLRLRICTLDELAELATKEL